MYKALAHMALLGAGASAFATNLQTGAFDVLAGGSDGALEVLGADCDAWVSAHETAHSFSVGSAEPFMILALSDEDKDLILIVEAPDRNIECADPAITFEHPLPGDYRVWVGTHKLGDVGADASLFIVGLPEELRGPWDVDVVEDPLRDDFVRKTTEIQAGGLLSTERLDGGGCKGFVGVEPSLSFRYGIGWPTLRIGVESPVDTTIVVLSPSGRLVCNDDRATGNRHAAVRIRRPEDGLYHVWVGTYAPADVGATASLVLETDMAAGVPELFLDGTGISLAAEAELVRDGTGFFVSADGHVLTNQHVVNGCERITFRRPGHTELEAELIRADAAADLALLRVGSQHGPFALFSTEFPAMVGQEIGILGFPEDAAGPSFTSGVISSLSGFEGDFLDFTHSAETRSGSSGSPIFDTVGNVIGIATGVLSTQSGNRPVNVNFGIRGIVIQLFLQANGVSIRHSSSDTSQTWTAIVEQADRFVGVIGCWQ